MIVSHSSLEKQKQDHFVAFAVVFVVVVVAAAAAAVADWCSCIIVQKYNV